MKNNKAEETVAEFFQYQENCFVMPEEKQIKAFKTVPEESEIENRRVRKIRYVPIIAACLAIIASIVSVIAVLELNENDIAISNVIDDSHDSSYRHEDSLKSEEIYSEVFQLSIYSYDEYVQFTKTEKLPEYFVSYEDVSEFGEFEGFVCLSNSRHGDYSSLLYSFVDETGTKVGMYVYYRPLRESAEDTEKPILAAENISASDMRSAQVTEACRFLHDGIEYSYYPSGKLHAIKWFCGDIQYILHEDLNTYPVTDKPTAISKMLNLETASQVASAMKSYTD